ncbi:hypothetical protein LCGC14_0532460 [marine sediment metagenome]|uniref:Uncharacterized protein n=1 Tax=marine sediment metagenome TaxID=412755 RepID=A0A0F9SDP5_9ZZZZ
MIIEELSDDALVEPPALPADKLTLREHYKKVQIIVACNNYEDMKWRCTWCLTLDRHVPVAYSRGGGRFCSEECRDGFAAHQATLSHEVTGKEIIEDEE